MTVGLESLPEPDFRTLFESAPGLFLVLTPDFKIVAASNAYVSATLTKRPEIIGRGVFEVFPDNPNDPKATGVSHLKASLQRVLTQKTADTMAVQKYDIQTPSSRSGGGEHFEVRYWAPANSPILDDLGNVKYIIHRVEDVTEFVRLRGLESESADKFRTNEKEDENFGARTTEQELNSIRYALDESAIVAITDRAGNITHVNKKFCEISKFPREELLGNNHRIINSAHHPKEFFSDMWKAISSGKSWEGEIKNRAKDGTHYWVYTTIVPFLDDRGRPYQYVAIRYEITQRKLAEEQLGVYAKRLEASNRELQDFASVAAHDLQEPLRKIQAFSDRLNLKYREALQGDGMDYLQRMQGSAKRMQILIDDLLTYSRVTSAAKPFLPTDLNQVVKDVLSDLEIRIEQSKARIDIEDLPTVDADALQMRQLLQNTIANALKFHRPDLPPAVKVAANIIRDRCELSISDNGIGFDQKYSDKIFTIFQRLHGRNEYEGTGVGLAVCRRIAERHGGGIVAKSAPGEGATFIITLPIRHY